jgi:arsenate reductase (glutaredoxin)
MAITIYGIPNCEQIKKTLAWFKDAGVAVDFHDYKKLGIDRATLTGWTRAVEWERLVNRAGTTWRKLPEATRDSVQSAATAIPVLEANPSLIKRPVVVAGGTVIVGYDVAAFAGVKIGGRGRR